MIRPASMLVRLPTIALALVIAILGSGTRTGTKLHAQDFAAPPMPPQSPLFSFEQGRRHALVSGMATVVAAAPDGTVYASKHLYNEIVRLDGGGRVLDRWNGESTIGRRFDTVIDIDVGLDGTVWLLESSSHVSSFDANGVPRSWWRIDYHASGLASLPGGDVLVADRAQTIHRHAEDGTERLKWHDDLSLPVGVDARPEYGIAVVDQRRSRLLWYDTNGRRLHGRPDAAAAWPERGTVRDVAIGPEGQVAISFEGVDRLLVADGLRSPFVSIEMRDPGRLAYRPGGELMVVSEGEVRSIEPSGAHKAWTSSGTFSGSDIRDLAVARDDHLIALVEGGYVLFDSWGARLSTWGPAQYSPEGPNRLRWTDFRHLALGLNDSRWLSSQGQLVHVSRDARELRIFDWSDLAGSLPDRAPAIANLPDGGLMVAEIGEGRLLRLDERGVVSASWPAPAIRGLDAARVVLASDDSLVLVAESLDRVLRFSTDGQSLDSWVLPAGSKPTDVTVTAEGGLLISDGPGSRLIRLDPRGNLIGAKSTSGWIGAISVLSDGSILSAAGSAEIRRGRPDGSFELQWWLYGGRFPAWGIGGVDVASDGSLLVSMAEMQQVHRYDRHGHFQAAWQMAEAETPVLNLAARPDLRRGASRPAARLAGPAGYGGLDIDEDDRVCAVQVRAGKVLCFSEDGRVTDRLGSPTARNERWTWPSFTWAGDVEFDSEGTMWVTEPWVGRVTGVRSDGAVVRLGVDGVAEADFEIPNGLTIAADGSVIVSDEMRMRLLRFAPDGRFLHAIGEEEGKPGALLSPEGLVAHDGVVDVADRRAGLIQRYTVDGRWIGSWGAEGGGSPRDLAFAEDGRAYVSTWTGIDVYDAPQEREWTVSLTGERGFEEVEPIWRTSASSVRLPGPTPPYADLLTDPVWHLATRLRRGGQGDPPVLRYHVEVAGRVRLRANGRELLYADRTEPGRAVYEGLVAVADGGTVVDVDYASGEQEEALELEWLPWEMVGRVHLPLVVR